MNNATPTPKIAKRYYPVGYWEYRDGAFDCHRFYTMVRPRWLTRVSARILFQLEWRYSSTVRDYQQN